MVGSSCIPRTHLLSELCTRVGAGLSCLRGFCAANGARLALASLETLPRPAGARQATREHAQGGKEQHG